MSKRIKGLLYRQLYLSKKSMLLGAALTLIFTAFELLVMLSMKYGNLADMFDGADTEDIGKVFYMLFLMFVSMTSFGTTVSDHNVLSSDIKCKWTRFAYTLPVSEKETALAKVIWMLAGYFAGLALCMINAALLGAVSGIPFQSDYIGMILYFGFFYSAGAGFSLSMNLFIANEQTANIVGMLLSYVAALPIPLIGMKKNFAEIDMSGFSTDYISLFFAPFGSVIYIFLTAAAFVMMYFLIYSGLKKNRYGGR